MISAPEDYGLSEQETAAFTVDDPLPSGFEAFWRQWREAVASMPVRIAGNTTDRQSEFVFESLRNVRIASRLTRPAGIVRGAVVTTHGYAAPEWFESGPEPWTDHGLATLRLRVRGYPPSTMDIEDRRFQWIGHNIHAADAWILNGAAADVVQGVRVLQHILGEHVPMALHGESFGGGLAVLAGAQLAQMNRSPVRMILATPTFGAWRWRLGRYCNGAGGEVNMIVESLRGDDQEKLLAVLDLYDAVHHARNITCPVWCKLALRDDVVPAPSAAAVFQALHSPQKWAFFTRFGHYDGGLEDARRHALFERLHPALADPGVDPCDVIRETALNVDAAVESDRK